MARQLAMLLMAAVLAAVMPACFGVGLNSACTAFGLTNMNPHVQTPTLPANYGKCVDIQAEMKPLSNWCKVKTMGSWPAFPNANGQKCMKFGRMTVYEGPIMGSTPAQKAACNKVLQGDDNAAMVAVSTRWLKTYQGGWAGAGNTGYCNQCMCIRLTGLDNGFNPNINPSQKAAASSSGIGMCFKGMVGDRCAECEDDHIDLLMDRPLIYAPWRNGDVSTKNAPLVNKLSGPRGFKNPQSVTTTIVGTPMDIGAYTVMWQWVPCGTTHAQCANIFKKMGYANSWAPATTPGVNV